MSNIILPILSASTIKQLIPQINNEIDNVLVDNNTVFVQMTLIRDTMTQDFYQDMYNKWTGHTMTAAYTTLKEEYIDWILALGVWQNIIITQSYQLNSAGLRLKTTDHSVAAEPQDISFMRQYIQNMIDSKRKDMQRYINDNQGNYPLYFSDKYGDTPKTKNFRIGRVANDELDNRCYGMDYPR